MRPRFRDLESPFIASIVQERSPEATMANILNSEHDGAKGFMVDITYLRDEDRSLEVLTRIFQITNRPIMPLVYRSANMTSDRCTDCDREVEMFKALDAGASSIDVMGDLYDEGAVHELTRKPEAIAKQQDLIARLHERGAEVLISSHTPDFMSAEEVLDHLNAQVERGADIAKIITNCNTEKEFLESVRTLILLKQEMKVPFIYLNNGKMGRMQRFIAPQLGCMLNFAIEKFNPQSLGVQPTVAAARDVLHEMSWRMNFTN